MERVAYALLGAAMLAAVHALLGRNKRKRKLCRAQQAPAPRDRGVASLKSNPHRESELRRVKSAPLKPLAATRNRSQWRKR